MNIPRTLLPFSYIFPPLPSFLLLLFPQLPFGAHIARTCTKGASPIYRFPAQEDSAEIKNDFLIAIAQKKVLIYSEVHIFNDSSEISDSTK